MEFPLGQRLRELPGPLLLTGHTGFKGTWMTFLLEHLSVPVIGYSLPREKDSLHDRAQRTGFIPEVFTDIRDYEALERFIDLHRPSTIIHMAAQPLVLESYESPRKTFDINVMGTVNLLDIAFRKDCVKAIIVVTTDKVYRNDNSGDAFVEMDALEGKDPYSASKVGTEAVVSAWKQISKESPTPRVASVRAGNVIGGGDFASNRIVPDLIRGVLNDEEVIIRNPASIRPWQHTIEPLVGYIMSLERLLSGESEEDFNFGPIDSQVSVQKLVDIASTIFPEIRNLVKEDAPKNQVYEAMILQLNSEKARKILNWTPKWNSEESIKRTFNWWHSVLNQKADASKLCKEEIRDYFSTGQVQ